MQTGSSSKLTHDQTYNPTSSTNTTPKGLNRRSSKQKVKNSNLEEHLPPVVTMVDNRTMAEMLRAPTEGCAEAIVVPPILAEQFDIKHSLINMMTSDQLFGLEKENPHDHIRWFNKITSTIKYRDVPNSVIKLILFPFSLVGVARRWLEKEPPHSITTWDDHVSKFINVFFPLSRTTSLCNEISNFEQKFGESFHEAWDRYKDLLRACPHHCFTELHQLNTFYNALNPTDQDSLNAAAGGNLLERSTQDVLTIIENKSKVCNSRSKSIASQVKACDTNSNSEIAKLTHAVNEQTSAVTTAMTAMLKQFQATPPPAPVKAVNEIYVTCGGAHPYYQCLAAGGNTFPEFRDNIQGYVSAAAVNNNQGASINLMPLFVWKELGLPKLIPTRMTLELANRAICTPVGITRDVFVPVGKFTFPTDFVIVDYESDPRVLLILGRPLLRTAHALINVHGEEMILRDGDERLTLNLKHDTSSYSNQPQRELVNLINIFNVSSEDFLEVSFSNQPSGNPAFLPHQELTSLEVNHDIHDSEGCNEIHPRFNDNPLSGSTTYFSNSLLEAFTDELALITYPPDYDDNLQFDIEFDLKEIEFLLYQGKDSSLKDSIVQKELANLEDNFVDPIPKMFTDEHAPDYSSPIRFDVYDDDFLEVESNAENVYDDLFDSKGEKIKESKLLIDELDLLCDFLPYSEYDSFNSQDFSRVDALLLTNNEDKVKEKQEKDKIRTKPDKNEKRGKTRQCQSPVTVKKAEKFLFSVFSSLPSIRDLKGNTVGGVEAKPRKGGGSLYVMSVCGVSQRNHGLYSLVKRDKRGSGRLCRDLLFKESVPLLLLEFRNDSYCNVMYRTPCPIKGVLSATITLLFKVEDPIFRNNKWNQSLEVIEFGDSYEAPQQESTTASASEGSAKKKGRTVAFTTDDMQKRRNDVNARTTLLLALPDEHQLRFSKSDLDTMSLDDLYNHLKVYEPEVQKKSKLNSQNMAFISSAKNSSGNEEVNTASIPTASTQVSPTGPNVSTASISLDTACAYIASQSNGSQIKFEDINQIDEDDIEEIDIKWNMALLSMRADRFWKKTGKKISIQGTDVAGFDKLKVECFNSHKIGHFARECRAPKNQDRGRRDNYRQGSKVEEHAPKALMAIDGVGWDWSFMENEEENHALVANEEVPTKFALMAKSSSDDEDMSWTGLLEFVDDTITDYSRPSRAIESNSNDFQNRNPSLAETGASSSTILSKPIIKFVKSVDRPTETKTDKVETAKKPAVKYAELYRKTSKSTNVRGNQRNWNNLKSHQLGKNFKTKNKACFNYGDFNHLSYDCGKWVDQGKSWAKNNYTHKSRSPRTVVYKSGRTPIKTTRPNMNSELKLEFQEFPQLIENFPLLIENFPLLTENFLLNNIDDKGYWDSGCSRHMTGNISYLSDYDPFDGGYVSFGQERCKITGKVTIKTECIVLGRNFKLTDDTNVLLRTPRLHNMYSIDLNNIVPHKDLTFLVAKASADECHLGKFEAKGDEGTDSTNVSGTKEAASQDVKKDVFSLRYIDLPNWFREAHLESSTSNAQDACNADASESSGNSNPTDTSTNPPADHIETLAVETLIPTISSPVSTGYLNDSPELSSDIILISKRVPVKMTRHL
nr:reverse transcriptase domain-containing protein [Tanacetum cinerariifolium]